MGYSSPLPPSSSHRRFVVALWVLVLVPGLGGAQAVPRTDTPRGGTLRITFEPRITTWEREYSDSGRRRIGATLPGTVLVRAERRDMPLIAEFGITNRLAIGVRLPLVRVRVQAQNDTTAVDDALDSLLADPEFQYAPIGNTSRRLRFFPGDAEVQAKYRLLVTPGGSYAASVTLIARLPTGHLESPHDLFDISTGDHQTDIEAQLTQELIVANRLWLNVAVRAGQQRPGLRQRRVGPQPHEGLVKPLGSLALLNWDPGDYLGLDVAPFYRFSRYFGAGFTAGYFTKQRDRYTYRSAQDSIAVETNVGAPLPASDLNLRTPERSLRLGVGMTYMSADMEGSFSVEQTVSGAGGRVPATTVFRVLMRTSRWPF